MKRAISLTLLLLALLVAPLVILLSQELLIYHGIFAQSAYPLPETSSISYPYPAPENVKTKPIATYIESDQVISVEVSFKVVVEGLRSNEIVELQMMPDTEKTSASLETLNSRLPRLILHNESQQVTASIIANGTYKLVIYASPEYYREPQGYLFQVTEAGIVGKSNNLFHFKLIPPSAQDLPPCRNLSQPLVTKSQESIPPEILVDEKALCMAEYIIDLSTPPKTPEPDK